jgi:hypothetical protein
MSMLDLANLSPTAPSTNTDGNTTAAKPSRRTVDSLVCSSTPDPRLSIELASLALIKVSSFALQIRRDQSQGRVPVPL